MGCYTQSIDVWRNPVKNLNRCQSFIIIAILILTALLSFSCSTTAIKTESFKTWDIHTEAQAQFLSSPEYTKPYQFGAKGETEMSKPVSPVLKWQYPGVNTGDIECSLFLISENADLSDAKQYEVSSGETFFTVPEGGLNLKTDTRYYWQIRATMKDGTVCESQIKSFDTTGGIRNLGVDGVTNFRDLGGFRTTDGGVVKQGLLYRSGRFNVKFEKTFMITETGLKQIHDLGIRTDIDLRGDKSSDLQDVVYANGYLADGSEIMVSPLGEDVNYVFIPVIWDTSLLVSPSCATMMQRIFEVLSNEENYPVVFHCSIGTDRTGLAAFLIGCALGLSDEDLTKDYLFSNFAEIGSPRLLANFSTSIRALKDYEGATYAQKGLDYLLKNGVTQEQIDKVKSILLSY